MKSEIKDILDSSSFVCKNSDQVEVERLINMTLHECTKQIKQIQHAYDLQSEVGLNILLKRLQPQ
jgi:hypothetical protein